jgi:transcriptional regulator with XRE-family HTH domain
MTPAQARLIRQRYGWTQAQLATLVGLRPLAVNRWENGSPPLRGPVAVLLHLFDALPEARQMAQGVTPSPSVVHASCLDSVIVQLITPQASRAVLRSLEGYTVPVVNATILGNEVADILCRGEAPAEAQPAFAAWYYDRADGQRQWGLWGHGLVDVGAIAENFGGSGHHDRAGFVTPAGWLPRPVERTS